MTDPDPIELYRAHLRTLRPLRGRVDALKARLPDPRARHDLIEGYLERTFDLAVELAPLDAAVLDAVQEANVALMGWVEQGAPGDPDVELPAAIVRRFAIAFGG